MLTRLRTSLSWQILASLVLGILVGGIIDINPRNVFCATALQICDLAGNIFLIGTRAFAVPLMVSGIILGAAGLEPMRDLRRIIWKTLGWVAVSTALAALTGLAVAVGSGLRLKGMGFRLSGDVFDPFWLGLVAVSLAFGFYRNQIEEGHARLLARFCQGVDEMLTPFMQWAMRLAPAGAFAVMVSYSSRQILLSVTTSAYVLPFTAIMLIGLMIYGLLILPTALWMLTRLNPWRYLRAVAPALLLALVCGSPLTVLPLTFDRVRRAAGVPNRIASVTLSLCGVIHRDGLALTWLAVGGLMHPGKSTLLLDAPVSGPLMSGQQGWIIFMVGAAVSVWSHACAAAVIAHSEGARNILSPPSPKDPLTFDELPAERV